MPIVRAASCAFSRLLPSVPPSLLVACMVCALGLVTPVASAQVGEAIRGSVVKIFATYRGPNYQTPWQKQPPSEVTGTGFVISGDRILTNAHVVEQSSQIFIQPHNTADRLRAEIVGISRGIDLAVLQIRREDERAAFHADRRALELRETLPEIGATVQAIGYPVGGEQQSVTEGVVSRIEFGDYYYETYGLRVQIDAAVNPGNSGGPVVLGEEVIGVTFSGIDQAENIGYVIPAEEVRAFLADIADGSYQGRPKLNINALQSAENESIRAFLGLTSEQTGVIFRATKHDDTTELEEWDVIDRIGPHDIDNDGLITIDGNVRLGWAYAVPREATTSADGSMSVSVTVIRKGQQVAVSLPVAAQRDFLMTYMGDDYPEYFVLGPMVFTPVRRDHMAELYTGYLAMVGSPIGLRTADMKAFADEELVAISADLLPHPITKGYRVGYFPTVKSLNGTAVRSLTHLIELVKASDDAFLVFEFHDMGQQSLVFDRDELLDATEEILEDNSIRNQGSERFMGVWGD